jgi:ectoine hydroxylase-related dioxygenase (phytanoyl-CoA dioxygenase family)
MTVDPRAIASADVVDDFERDGAVCLRGVFADWVDRIAEGVEANLASPGPHAAENVPEGQPGRFWDDYVNWQRIPAFEDVVRHSAAAPLAATLMRSTTAQFFHDHVLVKEPGTTAATPWHSDHPYYFIDGRQTVSFWIPLDPVGSASLRVIAGSHRWANDVRPTRWLAGTDFYEPGTGSPEFADVPDPDSDPERFRVLEWDLEPGDALAFHFRAVHGARGNPGSTRRRAFSMRFVGDDARYVERPGPTSPPFPGHGMSPGDRLRTDWFPVLFGRSVSGTG